MRGVVSTGNFTLRQMKQTSQNKYMANKINERLAEKSGVSHLKRHRMRPTSRCTTPQLVGVSRWGSDITCSSQTIHLRFQAPTHHHPSSFGNDLKSPHIVTNLIRVDHAQHHRHVRCSICPHHPAVRRAAPRSCAASLCQQLYPERVRQGAPAHQGARQGQHRYARTTPWTQLILWRLGLTGNRALEEDFSLVCPPSPTKTFERIPQSRRPRAELCRQTSH